MINIKFDYMHFVCKVYDNDKFIFDLKRHEVDHILVKWLNDNMSFIEHEKNKTT